MSKVKWTEDLYQQRIDELESEKAELRAYIERDKASTGAAQVIRLIEQLQNERKRVNDLRGLLQCACRTAELEADGDPDSAPRWLFEAYELIRKVEGRD